jgi:UPF0755 protein
MYKRGKLLLLVTVLSLSIASILGLLWFDYQRFLITPLHQQTQPILISIPKGTGANQLAQQLIAKGLLTHPYYFLGLIYWQQQVHKLQAGDYWLDPGLNPGTFLDRIVSGKTAHYPVTLIEGRTFRDIIADLATYPYVQSTLATLSEQACQARLQLPIEQLEGWFLPETYYVQRGVTDVAVLRRAYHQMQTVLNTEWENRDADLPLPNPYAALILASIVEKETAQADERPLIAGVFMRRLRRNMRLQTDPTVIYGLGADYTGNLSRADLKRDTPYNTYTRSGLPPTPIALASAESIRAVMHPTDDDTLYFVATGDGGHYFSASLSEHQCAVRRYQLGRACDLSRYQ